MSKDLDLTPDVRSFDTDRSLILPPFRRTGFIDIDAVKFQGHYYEVYKFFNLYLLPGGIVFQRAPIPGTGILPLIPLPARQISPGERNIPADDDRNMLYLTSLPRTTSTVTVNSVYIPTASPLNNISAARALLGGAHPSQLIGSAVFDSRAQNALFMWSQSTANHLPFAQPDELTMGPNGIATGTAFSPAFQAAATREWRDLGRRIRETGNFTRPDPHPQNYGYPGR